jgi:hypothetical protein
MQVGQLGTTEYEDCFGAEFLAMKDVNNGHSIRFDYLLEGIY